MKTFCAVFAMALALFATAVRASDDPEISKMEGRWLVTAMAINGKSLAVDAKKRVTLTFSKDGNVVSEGGEKGRQDGTFKIDSTRQPKTIDIVTGMESMSGLYTVEADTLTLAMRVATKKEIDAKALLMRPLTMEGEGVMKITLTRQKNP